MINHIEQMLGMTNEDIQRVLSKARIVRSNEAQEFAEDYTQ